MLIDPSVVVCAGHPDGGSLCEGPPTERGFTDPMGRISCPACIAAGVHQPTELGNMMGGYDCACGGAWVALSNCCTNTTGEAGK